MPDSLLILGVTRLNDDPHGPATGLILREGEKLRNAPLAERFNEDGTPKTPMHRLIPEPGNLIAYQKLARFERVCKGSTRFLFLRDGKLEHHELREALQFSDAKKSLLSPQVLGKDAAWAPLIVAYLEISRLSDVMRAEPLGGERDLGKLAALLNILPSDPALSETLWELARRKWLTVHELGGKPADNAVALNKPIPALKG